MNRRNWFLRMALAFSAFPFASKLLWAASGWKEIPGPGDPTMTKVLRVRRAHPEYEIRRVKTIWHDATYPKNGGWVTVERDKAFTIPTPDGSRASVYIGDPDMAKFLVEDKGLTQLQPRIGGGDAICQIGFCPGDGKWYGWSHRAICGFGGGDRVFDERYALADDHTPFTQHGDRMIESWEDARLAASNFAQSVA